MTQQDHLQKSERHTLAGDQPPSTSSILLSKAEAARWLSALNQILSADVQRVIIWNSFVMAWKRTAGWRDGNEKR